MTRRRKYAGPPGQRRRRRRYGLELGPRRAVTAWEALDGASSGGWLYSLECGHAAFRVPLEGRPVRPRTVRCLECLLAIQAAEDAGEGSAYMDAAGIPGGADPERKC